PSRCPPLPHLRRTLALKDVLVSLGTLGAARLPAKRERALLRTAVRRAHWSTFALRAPVFALGTARRAHAPRPCARNRGMAMPPGAASNRTSTLIPIS